MRLFACAILLCISAGAESASAAKEAVYEEDSATPGIFCISSILHAYCTMQYCGQHYTWTRYAWLVCLDLDYNCTFVISIRLCIRESDVCSIIA